MGKEAGRKARGDSHLSGCGAQNEIYHVTYAVLHFESSFADINSHDAISLSNGEGDNSNQKHPIQHS
jgi:hypothetical protein